MSGCHQHPQGTRLLTTRSTSSPMQLEDERARLTQSGYFNDQEVFRQVDRRETDRVQPQDIINFLGVHRIAANERECQFLIWTAGSNEPYLTFAQYFFPHPDSPITSPMAIQNPSITCRAQASQAASCQLTNCCGITVSGSWQSCGRRRSSTTGLSSS